MNTDYFMNQRPYDFSHGYMTDGYLDNMSYNLWAESMGKYRWYHDTGTARAYYPLDYNWELIYNSVVKHADIAFGYRGIDLPVSFTAEFLARVPLAWLKFKTQLELLTGDLAGMTIDPDIFEAGYTRITNSRLDNSFENKGIEQGNQDLKSSENLLGVNVVSGSSDDTNKNRGISYQQGIQGYDNQINNDNIGELGNDFASNMIDNITINKNINNSSEDKNENRIRTDIVNNQNDLHNSGKDDSIFHEKVDEKRVNFYDNLAFLRERMEQMHKIQPFHIYFNDLFLNVNSYGKWF